NREINREIDLNPDTPTTGTSEENEARVDWEELAEGMSRALVKHFWGANFEGYPDRYYFNYGSDLSNMTTNHYWPQAHAMDVLVDSYKRTSDQFYRDFYP